MPVKFQNFDHSYKLNGKPVFSPTDLGRQVGNDVKSQVEAVFSFPNYYYHLKKGGHIAALHLHRRSKFFCKVDISNFFYSCGRNRVAECLRAIGVRRHHHYAKWSCVKNPFDNFPRYSLPYGFVQSPILASLVLAHSALGEEIDRLSNAVNISVFVDDIAVSSDDPDLARDSLERLLLSFNLSPFNPNTNKTVETANSINIFNCHLSHNTSFVTQDRVDNFYSTANRSVESIAGFEEYCDRVKR